MSFDALGLPASPLLAGALELDLPAHLPPSPVNVAVATPQLASPPQPVGDKRSREEEAEGGGGGGGKRQRMERVLQHRYTERVRREKTNEILSSLRVLARAEHAKRKVDVLDAVLTRMKELTSEVERLREERASPAGSSPSALAPLSPADLFYTAPSASSSSVSSSSDAVLDPIQQQQPPHQQQQPPHQQQQPPHQQQQQQQQQQQPSPYELALDVVQKADATEVIMASRLWSSGIAIVCGNLNMQCVGFNRQFERMTGFSTADLRHGLACASFSSPRDLSCIYNAVSQLMTTSMSEVFMPRRRWRRKDGTLEVCRTTVTLVLDEHQRPSYIYAVISPTGEVESADGGASQQLCPLLLAPGE